MQPSLVKKLLADLDASRREEARADLEVLLQHWRASSVSVPLDDAHTVLQGLLAKRMFPEVLLAAEELARGNEDDPKVGRIRAQALIDTGLVSLARRELERLEREPGDQASEIAGLLGRAHKQIFVDSPHGKHAERSLHSALRAYHGYFHEHSDHVWFGINAAALVARAERDGRSLPAGVPSSLILAKQVRDKLAGQSRDFWDEVTLAEAYVALGDLPAAAQALTPFLRQAPPFALGSHLRQLREVWQFSDADPIQSQILAALEAALMRHDQGALTMKPEELRQARQRSNKRPEGIFGDYVYQTIDWWRTGLNASGSVGRVKKKYGTTHGSGFLVDGGVVKPEWSGRQLFVTNYHVLNDAGGEALKPNAAEVVFDALDPPVTRSIRGLVCQLPMGWGAECDPSRLDTTVAELSDTVNVRAPLEVGDGSLGDQVYLIGYAEGRELAFSFQDNQIVDRNAVALQYRTPTASGNSGSPVFDDLWRVVGVHHGSGYQLEKLSVPEQTHEANEGFLLTAIRDAVCTAMP